MQITEQSRNTCRSGEVISEFQAGRLSVRLISSFGDRASFDNLLYAIACQKITERMAQKRDNIALAGGYGTLLVGK